MTQITVNGNTYSDDGSTAKDMQAGGFRINLLKMISDLMASMVTNLGIGAGYVTAAQAQVTAAQGQVTLAAAQATAAAASAASAVAAPGTNATSTSVVTLVIGATSLTVQTGKAFVAGSFVTIASAANPGKYLGAQITAYNPVSGLLNVNAVLAVGTGTFADGVVALSAPMATGAAWAIKTAAYTAINGDCLMCNTAGGAFPVALPAAPAAGFTVRFCDYAGTFATNNLTVTRNGSSIMGVAQDMTISTNNASITLTYIDATQGWKLT